MTSTPFEDRRNRFSVIWMRFLQRVQKNPNAEVWVIEGKDDIAYYSPRIESIYGSPVGLNALIAEGKENSLRLRKEVEANDRYSSVKIAFFLDLDYDTRQEIAGSNTYITPTYSIENLYFDDSSIQKFLIECLHLRNAEDQAEFNSAFMKIIAWRDNASEAIAPFCALLAELKLHLPASQKLATQLNERLIGEIIQVQKAAANVTPRVIDSHTKICESLTPTICISESDILSIVERWRTQTGGKLYKAIRGKFLSPFLHAALSLVIEDSNKKNDREIFLIRRPCNIQLRPAELLHTLTNYAETPICLKEFLLALRINWAT